MIQGHVAVNEYTVTVNVSSSGHGSVSTKTGTSTITVKHGTEIDYSITNEIITINPDTRYEWYARANADENFDFGNWEVRAYKGNELVDPPTDTITSDVEFSAVFTKGIDTIQVGITSDSLRKHKRLADEERSVSEPVPAYINFCEVVNGTDRPLRQSLVTLRLAKNSTDTPSSYRYYQSNG